MDGSLHASVVDVLRRQRSTVSASGPVARCLRKSRSQPPHLSPEMKPIVLPQPQAGILIGRRHRHGRADQRELAHRRVIAGQARPRAVGPAVRLRSLCVSWRSPDWSACPPATRRHPYQSPIPLSNPSGLLNTGCPVTRATSSTYHHGGGVVAVDIYDMEGHLNGLAQRKPSDQWTARSNCQRC